MKKLNFYNNKYKLNIYYYKMEQIIINVVADKELEKLLNYGLNIITKKPNHNIIIKNNDENVKYYDCLIFRIQYEKFIDTESLLNNLNDFILTNTIENKFTKLLVIVEYNNENFISHDTTHINIIKNLFFDIKDNDIDICYINVKKALNYLSVVRDDITIIDENIINEILQDELGKQKYKKLDSIEKKRNEITNLSKNEDIVNDWMKSFGFDEFINILEKNFVDFYDKYIQSHALQNINFINNEIVLLKQNNNKISLGQVMELIINLLNCIDVFIKYLDTNTVFNCINNDGFEIVETIVTSCNNDDENINNNDTVYYTNLLKINNNIFENINEYIINYLILADITENNLESYTNCIVKYINTFKISNSMINNIKNELMKKKMLLRFDEQLFNELLNDNDDDFFVECIGTWLVNDPNNFTDLIKFAKKINSPYYINKIMEEFVDNDEIDNKHNKYKNICTDKFIDSSKMIFDKNIYDYNNSIDTIFISSLLFKMVKLIYKENCGSIVQTEYIFDKYISLIDYCNNDLNILFIHNIHYNYKILLDKYKQSYSYVNTMINFKSFILTYDFFGQILEILFDFVNLKHLILNNNKNDTNNKDDEDKDEEKDDEDKEDDEDKDKEDDEDEDGEEEDDEKEDKDKDDKDKEEEDEEDEEEEEEEEEEEDEEEIMMKMMKKRL